MVSLFALVLDNSDVLYACKRLQNDEQEDIFVSYSRADFNYNGISFLWLRFQYVGKNTHSFPCNSALLLVCSGLCKGKQEKEKITDEIIKPCVKRFHARLLAYSTVTDLAKFLGLSMSHLFNLATLYASS